MQVIQKWFPDGFHLPLSQSVLCWGSWVRQTSCLGGFAEVGLELTPMAAPRIALITQVESRELLEYAGGVFDGVQAMIGDPPGIYGGIEIRWVRGVKHPVDSSRRAFAIATQVALAHALGVSYNVWGMSGGVGSLSRQASRI